MPVEREHKAEVAVAAATVGEAVAAARAIEAVAAAAMPSEPGPQVRITVRHAAGYVYAASAAEAEAETASLVNITSVDLSIRGDAVSIHMQCSLGNIASILTPYCAVRGVDEIVVLGLARKIELTLRGLEAQGRVREQAGDQESRAPDGAAAGNTNVPVDAVHGPEPEPARVQPTTKRRVFEGVAVGVAATVLIWTANAGWQWLKPEGPRELRLGDAAVDGPFRFRGTEWKCGVVSKGRTSPPPSGQYCSLDLTVMNVSDTAQDLIGPQYVAHIQGDKYPAVSKGNPSDIGQLFPRRSVTFDVVFDVPAHESPETVTIHGEYGSRGIKYVVSASGQ